MNFSFSDSSTNPQVRHFRLREEERGIQLTKTTSLCLININRQYKKRVIGDVSIKIYNFWVFSLFFSMNVLDDERVNIAFFPGTDLACTSNVTYLFRKMGSRCTSTLIDKRLCASDIVRDYGFSEFVSTRTMIQKECCEEFHIVIEFIDKNSCEARDFSFENIKFLIKDNSSTSYLSFRRNNT